MHIFEKNDQYIIYNDKTASLYRIPAKIGRQLADIGDHELSIMEQLLTTKDKTPVTILGKEHPAVCRRLVVAICQDCNLGCKYCYAQQGTYGDSGKTFMTMRTYMKSIDLALRNFPDGIAQIQFFGGEPLLNFTLMKKACHWTKDYFAERNLEMPQFTVITNGTIMNQDITDLFDEFHFRVTVSLDGNKEINDRNRIYKGSKNSVFDTVVKNIQYLKEHCHCPFMIEMSVDTANIHQFLAEDSLKDVKTLLALEPYAIHIVPVMWADEDHVCNSPPYRIDLIKYFDELARFHIEENRKGNTVTLTKVYHIINQLGDKKLKKYFCTAGLEELSIDAQGDIYPCFMLIGENRYMMGNVYREDTEKYDFIINELLSNTMESNEKCSSCWAKGLCSNCIGGSYLQTGDIRVPSENMCRINKVQIERAMAEIVVEKPILLNS